MTKAPNFVSFVVKSHYSIQTKPEKCMGKTPSRWFAETETQVQFNHLDPMEIVWHGHYVNYLEIVRSVLLTSVDYNYPQMKASGYVWPVIDLHIRYVAPAKFAERLKLRAEIVEWENRLKIAYLLTDGATGRRVGRASTTQVAVELATGEMCFVSPPVLFEKLGLTPP